MLKDHIMTAQVVQLEIQVLYLEIDIYSKLCIATLLPYYSVILLLDEYQFLYTATTAICGNFSNVPPCWHLQYKMNLVK